MIVLDMEPEVLYQPRKIDDPPKRNLFTPGGHKYEIWKLEVKLSRYCKIK